MKALTLTQPWATLVISGRKQFETRSWGTRYRGPLAIHAGARMSRADRNTAAKFGFLLSDLPLGAVLGIVELADVEATDTVRRRITWIEDRFGDFTPGRFAWRLPVVEVFETPVPARGRQGLWNWPRQ